MSRAYITIGCKADRERASKWAMQAPSGTRIEFKEAKRSLDQNSLMWSRLTEIAVQVVWDGKRRSPTDWKDIFTAALRKAEVVPGIDSGTTVLLGLHTSEMSKDEMGNLLDLMDAFAAEHGVTFRELESA